MMRGIFGILLVRPAVVNQNLNLFSQNEKPASCRVWSSRAEFGWPNSSFLTQ
jgi:hypothetical protein